MTEETREKSRRREIIEYIALIVTAIMVTQGIQFGAKIILHVDTPFVVVASGSMEPTLNVGDLLIVKGTDPNELHVGEIVIFKPPEPYWRGIPWVHRIIDIEANGDDIKIKTKGDANAFPDPFWLKSENIIGAITMKIPYVGLLSLTMKNWIIPITILIAVIIILILILSKE